jgi:tetratricopeptide (TPR) repeat protein
LLQGELLYDLGSIPDSIGAYRQALALAGVDVQRCRARIGLAEGLRIVDRPEEALSELDQAEAVATRHAMVPELARVHYLRGNLYFPLGQLARCLEHHQRACDLARRAHSPELEALALGGLGDADYARGRMHSAHDHFRRCVELCRAHGFGRTEVANFSMVAYTGTYLHAAQDALDESLRAIASAARVGHRRAEIVARHAAFSVLCAMGELEQAVEHTERAGVLSKQLGARRFDAENLSDQAFVLLMQGRRAAALALLEQAIAISCETGVKFVGPWILGRIALATDDPPVRQSALEEGEQLLRQGCVSHNYLWFYRDAINVSLNVGDWAEAERFAAALEGYTRAQPLPWSDFHIAKGRVLAAIGRGGRDEATLRALKQLLAEAERLAWKAALPALQEALARWA